MPSEAPIAEGHRRRVGHVRALTIEDLPAPLGPISPVTRPKRTEKVARSTIARPPRTTVSPATEMASGIVASFLAANEEHEKHGGPDETRDHPEWHDAPGRQHTDYEIARCNEYPAAQGGDGD